MKTVKSIKSTKSSTKRATTTAVVDDMIIPVPSLSALSGSSTDTIELSTTTFKELGIVDALCDAITSIGWLIPTEIQRETIPEALKGKDIIGLAETGSGKTGLGYKYLCIIKKL